MEVDTSINPLQQENYSTTNALTASSTTTKDINYLDTTAVRNPNAEVIPNVHNSFFWKN